MMLSHADADAPPLTMMPLLAADAAAFFRFDAFLFSLSA